jgi:hypothetical protein
MEEAGEEEATKNKVDASSSASQYGRTARSHRNAPRSVEQSRKYATTHSVREKGVPEGAWVVVRVCWTEGAKKVARHGHTRGREYGSTQGVALPSFMLF